MTATTMSNEELHTHTDLELARPREIALLLTRALTLRCPHCGSGGVASSPLKLRARCPKCGLRLERGEHDYFTGSMLFNFVFSELLFAFLFTGYLLAMHGNVNWDLLQYVLAAIVGLAPIVMYAMSKLLWLAFDLMLRPVTRDELQWHRSQRNEFSTGLDLRVPRNGIGQSPGRSPR